MRLILEQATEESTRHNSDEAITIEFKDKKLMLRQDCKDIQIDFENIDLFENLIKLVINDAFEKRMMSYSEEEASTLVVNDFSDDDEIPF